MANQAPAAGTPPRPTANDNAAKAIRFLLIKAAIFIGVPVLASAIAVAVLLSR